MPTKKATSAAPAASRTRAPQTAANAAGRRTQTREGLKRSTVIVREPAKPLQDDGLDGPIFERSDTRVWGGSLHNTALAQAAEAEARCDDLIVSHLTSLSVCPMFRLLAEAYKLKRATHKKDDDWELCMFAARVFHAGVCAGRAERGRMTIDGALILDEPWRPMGDNRVKNGGSL